MASPSPRVGDSSNGSFHALRQWVWWKEDTLLAVGVSGEGAEEGGAFKEEVLRFSLNIDKDNKLVKIVKW